MPGPKLNFRVKHWLPVFLCMAAIFYSSSIPACAIPGLFELQDAFFHLAAYGLLGFLFARALRKTANSIPAGKICVYALILGLVYGASDEFHQSFVPGRLVSGLDLFFDLTGSLLGSIIYTWQR